MQVFEKLSGQQLLMLCRAASDHEVTRSVPEVDFERQYMELLRMDWNSPWTSSLSFITDALMEDNDVRSFLLGDEDSFRRKHDWIDLQYRWRNALSDDFFNKKYHPLGIEMSQKPFKICTAGDALLNLGLTQVAAVVNEEWEKCGHVVPRYCRPSSPKKASELCVYAGRNDVLGRVYHMLDVEKRVPTSSWITQDVHKIDEHDRGDIMEHIIALLFLDVDASGNKKEMIACCLMHVARWVAMHGLSGFPLCR